MRTKAMPHSGDAPPQIMDARELRRALGQFATGVTIPVSRDADGAFVGLTANSFTSVSLDPPLVLWSLRRESASHQAFRAADHFLINVLSADQLDLARRFSARVADRFENVRWTPSKVSGLPILEGAAAAFDCRTVSRLDAGDHCLFIGEVVSFAYLERHPLLFHGGSYRLAAEPIS